MDKVLAGLNAKEVAEQLSVPLALMRPSPAAMFNAEMNKLTAVCFNSAAAAAVAEDNDRNDGQKTLERAVSANGQDHHRHKDDIPTALQAMMTSPPPRQALAKVKRALR